MILKFRSDQPIEPHVLSFVCPVCSHWGTFISFPGIKDVFGLDTTQPSSEQRIFMGQRMCPNPGCRALVFVIYANGEFILTYPAIRIDFDKTNIPPNILKVFDEALACHANQCYTAAAIMVRRALEEICEDRKAVGNTLKQRLDDLKGKIIIPQELLEGLDELRLLGNDAAHIEAQTYNRISNDELELAIGITKEILKGLYQYDSLVKRLQALKKNNNP